MDLYSVRFGSVCSGIEAASVAWHPLGWSPAWFAEIDPFPSAVLTHHYPTVPNLGDMTTIAARVAAGEVEAPDVLVGGTPCQSFSVAGLRGGMSDARGQLTLSFVELANAIDAARAVRGLQPSVIVWENVPGALSSKDNAFGCFLGALVGEDCELQPPGKRWANAGCVFGPQRAVAWRVLDAQYFGVAQRRRRVFVVASARDGFDPAAVLFEFEGLRRDSAPSREPGQGAAADVAPSLTASGRGVERIGETRGQDPVIAQCLTTGTGQRYDPETETILPVAYPLLEVGKRTGKSTTDPRAGLGIGNDNDPMYTLQASAQHGVASVPAIALQTDVTPKASEELAFTLKLPSATGGGQPAACMTPQMAVRRLTPRECERLQGFPDDYTLVPHRGKPAADGPRYKALGNSMAVPCMYWIGRRLSDAIITMDSVA